jgi:hypothetical protein
MSRISLVRTASVLILLAMTAVLAAPLAAAPAAATPNPIVVVPGNLLTNPSFEPPYNKQCCHTEPNFPANQLVDEVQVPFGWSGWWRQPSFPDFPPRCDDALAPQTNCVAFHRPEWRDAAAGGGAFNVFANRIHSGLNAEKYFTFYSVHEAGMFQQVTSGVAPGQRLRFTVYMQAWSTNDNSLTSSGQQTMNLKVGIDPFGGTDAFSPNIVWSAPGDSYDVYSQFAIEAVAQSNKVTVFTYSRPIYPLQHDDVYVDDAALVVVGAGQPASSTAAGGARGPGNVGSPFPGTTVDADGNILYVVVTGDTAWSISRRFNTTVAQLVAWNNLNSSFVVRLGKTLIVGRVKK